MLTLDAERLRLLATSENVLGSLLATLAFPKGFETSASALVETLPGWEPCQPGPVAAARYGDAPMQGYTQPGSGVVLTLAVVAGRTNAHAEGDGWAIETEGGPYCDWAPSGTYSEDGFAKSFAALSGTLPRSFDPFGDEPVSATRRRIPNLCTEIRMPSSGVAAKAPDWVRPRLEPELSGLADPDLSFACLVEVVEHCGFGWREVMDERRQPLDGIVTQAEAHLAIENRTSDMGQRILTALGHLPVGRADLPR